MYARKTDGAINDATALRMRLNAIAEKYKLIDVTIKIYDAIFFMFFQSKPSLVPQHLIDTLESEIMPFAEWDQDYLWTGVYDVQEKYVREYLEKHEFEYDEG